jgi:peptidyl-prolyl cis-trans isomerase D
MLSTIREKTQGWIAAIILGLIGIPFALFGINYYFDGGSTLKVAEVNGTDISVDAYRRTLDEQRRSLTRLLGRNADPRIFDSPEFRQRVLDGLVDETLVASSVSADGYRIGNAELARQISIVPQFQRDGQFDPQLYQLLLRNAGMDVRGFEERLRRDVLVRQAESGYAQSAIVTPTDSAALLRLQAQEREAAVALLKPARLRDRVKVGNDAIEQEYSTHPDRYRTTERVRIEYIRLSAADLSKDIHVSGEELRQAQTESAQAAAGKEQRRASHILIKLAPGADAESEKAATARIQSLRAKLTAGADFMALARQNSEDTGSAAQGGDLGFIERGSLAREFEQALYALKKPGELSAPVRTSFGLHLIKLSELKGGTAPAVNRVAIENGIRLRKAEARFFEMSERFQNLVYEQPDSLKPAAEALGLRIETSDWFTRAGSGSGLAAQPKVIEAAFDPEVLGQGRNSAAIEAAPNTLVALRIAAHEAARPKPLGEVRAEIEKALLAAAQRSEAERLSQEALRKLGEGGAFDAVIREYGMEGLAPRRYSRKTSGVDAQLLAAIFSSGQPVASKPVYGSAYLADGSVAVIALRRVLEPDKVAAAGPDAAAVQRALEARRGREYFDSHRAGLREQARIKVYKDQL